MTDNNRIIELLATPLSADWTVESLAEQLLCALAASETDASIDVDEGEITERQSRRLFRPLLACLATKSAAEAGTTPSLYSGDLSFKRPGPKGTVWLLGSFENRQGNVRLTLRRACSSNNGPDVAKTVSAKAS